MDHSSDARLRELMENFIPFNKFLGMKCEELRKGFVRFALPFREEFIGDPLRRAIHGGVISTMADVAGGTAVWTELRDPTKGRVSTIDLRVDYLRPGRTTTLVAEASVVRQGNRVGVADVRLFHPDDPAATIATGKGVYNIKMVKDESSE